MAYQCGMFLNKLKRGIVNHTSSHGSNTASEEGPQQGKDSHAAIICKSSDWSQFEGVLESGLCTCILISLFVTIR